MDEVLSKLMELRASLGARAENAYCEMISVARRDESLGWEAKVDLGQFRREELNSHVLIGEKLGRHRALSEVCRELDTMTKERENG